MESQAVQGENKGKGKEFVDVSDVGELAEPSNKDKKVAHPAEYEHVEVTRSEIFASCKSIGKIKPSEPHVIEFAIYVIFQHQ